MFYVYDLDGLRFRGPLEALERNRKVERSAPASPMMGGEAATPFSEMLGSQQPGNQAVAAYRQATSRDNLVEPLVHIYQIMSSPVKTISGGLLLVEAWDILVQEGIRQLVVVSENHQVTGILSDRDILKRINVVEGEVEVELALTARDVMQREVITTDSMSDIRRVARVMAFYHIDSMPVTRDNGLLIGIVTRGDILRNFAENPKLNLWA